MRFVHKFTAFAIIAFTAFLLAGTAFAEPAPTSGSPWGLGDDVYAFDVGFTNTSGEKDIDLTGSWLTYTGANHRVGVTLLYLNNDGGAGWGLGPSYEFLFPKLKYGRLGVGGDATKLGQDFTEAGAVAAATRVWYEAYVGDTAAIRIQARFLQALGGGDPAAQDQVNQWGLNIGILLGKTKAAPVT